MESIIETVAGGTQAATETSKLDYIATKHAAMVLRAVNHKLRQHIIKLIEDNTQMNVSDIYVKMRLEQSVASQHLAILRRSGIVSTERRGKEIYYSINHLNVKNISTFVSSMARNPSVEN